MIAWGRTIAFTIVFYGLSREQCQALWEQRVDSLRALAGFESNRRWLQSQGAVYDAALVVID